jgi:stage III sporulation protein AD
VFSIFSEISARANINKLYLETILKIIAIAYISEFGAQICRDAGQGAIASKIEFAAKIMVVVMAVPIIGAVLEMVVGLFYRRKGGQR